MSKIMQYPFKLIYQVYAPAKVNLWLDIVGVRSDGYHLLSTVMQTIGMADQLTVFIGSTEFPKLITSDSLNNVGAGVDQHEKWPLSYTQVAVVGNTVLNVSDRVITDSALLNCAVEDNLIVKAAQQFLQLASELDVPRIKEEHHFICLDLIKNIPAQAGLGGGSSDAAAVLRVLNDYFQVNATQTGAIALHQLASRIGADVPFALVGGTAHCTGIGEVIDALSPMDPLPILLMKPDYAVATGTAFRTWRQVSQQAGESLRRPDVTTGLAALKKRDYKSLAMASENVFEPVIATLYPEFTNQFSAMVKQSPLLARMSGSGSVIFGIFSDQQSCDSAKSILEDSDATAGCQFWSTHLLPRLPDFSIYFL
ncbi:MAG: 4-(cytidine 5'-diphospho)-2-C-methyl-D-erythritol kinase [Fastidiosipilaceae bacterium]|nr:hypothetical protein [Clostridiaceae bacterium]